MAAVLMAPRAAPLRFVVESPGFSDQLSAVDELSVVDACVPQLAGLFSADSAATSQPISNCLQHWSLFSCDNEVMGLRQSWSDKVVGVTSHATLWCSQQYSFLSPDQAACSAGSPLQFQISAAFVVAAVSFATEVVLLGAAVGQPRASLLHCPSSTPSPVHPAPPRSSTCLARDRFRTPTPQVREHMLQDSQSSHSQSTGHGCSLQSLGSVATPKHSFPPCCLFLTFARVRLLTPPPQDTEHVDQTPQLPHSQSTGQGERLQSCCSSEEPWHGVPSKALFWATMRDLACVPLPHVVVQRVQVLQSPQVQSTGQPCALHVMFSYDVPSHAFPPKAPTTTTLRFRPVWPVPQVLEQAVQTSQFDHLQSIGQPLVLQASSSEAVPLQRCPPHASRTATVRARCVTPPPQLAVQVDQIPHSLHWQSTGQPLSLQVPCSVDDPLQAVPPCMFGVNERVRKR